MKLGIAAVLLALLVLVLGPRARAATGIRVVGEPVAENQFPEGILFAIEAESDTEIREARLRYTFLPENRSSSAQGEFQPGARVRATFNLRSQSSSSRYMPPGKRLRYAWELRDAAGNEFRTEEREIAFRDPRFQWQQVVDGIIAVNYYRGTPRDAEVMAQVAKDTIDKAAELMATTFDFPIQIWAYNSQRDFQIALAHSSVSSDPGVLGQAHEPDIFIMVVDRLSSPSALDTMRHELTHLVTAQATRGGPFKDLYPAWLNEGTSVYLQVSPNDVGYVDALEDAIKKDRVLPIRSLTSGMRARDVNLFYGQSYGLVKYLIESHGAAKFAQMIAEFRQNGNEDQTFQKIYGFDRDGLFREWRTSVGLPAEAAARQQTGDGRGQAAATDDGGTDGATVALLAGAGVAMVLLAGAAVAGGLLLARRARGDGTD